MAEPTLALAVPGTPATTATGPPATDDAGGFIRYQHSGEGTYEDNEEEIQELLAERNAISS